MELIGQQVKPEAIVVLRTHENALTCEAYGLLTAFDTRRWGAMKIRFYRKSEHQEEHKAPEA